MSIFIDKSTKLLVQGITGRDGSFHAKQMMEYGTNVVAGVTPGKGGQKFESTVPIFNTVA
jgi:succinyl-CoA synthetase alpha subunit